MKDEWLNEIELLMAFYQKTGNPQSAVAGFLAFLEREIKKAVLEEREACAQVAEYMSQPIEHGVKGSQRAVEIYNVVMKSVRSHFAKAIRERG